MVMLCCVLLQHEYDPVQQLVAKILSCLEVNRVLAHFGTKLDVNKDAAVKSRYLKERGF